MRSFLFALALVTAAPALAQDVIVSGPRRTVIVEGGAQGHAVTIARRGALVHARCGQTEGIGFSTISADHAIRSCCFWGRRQAVDIGVAWSPIRRGWFAVVRYR